MPYFIFTDFHLNFIFFLNTIGTLARKRRPFRYHPREFLVLLGLLGVANSVGVHCVGVLVVHQRSRARRRRHPNRWLGLGRVGAL